MFKRRRRAQKTRSNRLTSGVSSSYTRLARLEPLEDRRLLSVNNLIVTSLEDVVDIFDGKTTLREALYVANSNQVIHSSAVEGEPQAGSSTAIDRITFSDELFIENGNYVPRTITLAPLYWIADGTNDPGFVGDGIPTLFISGSGGPIEIDGYVPGSTENLLTISISGGREFVAGQPHGVPTDDPAEYRLFTVGSGAASVIISDLTLTGGMTMETPPGSLSPHAPSYENGGGIYNSGNLTLQNVAIANCTAAQSGGAICNTSMGNLTLNDVTITGTLPNQTVLSTIDRDPEAGVSGGGIYNAGTLTIYNSTITECDTRWGGTHQLNRGGGGVFNDGTMTVDGLTVSYCSSGYGGGIFNATGRTITVSANSDGQTSLTLENNEAIYGGGLFNKGTLDTAATGPAGSTPAPTTWTALTVNHCGAGEKGGGIYNVGIILDSSESVEPGNPETVMLKLDGNWAPEGGGLYQNGTAMTIAYSNISNNSTDFGYPVSRGAGIANHSTLTITHSNILNNSARRTWSDPDATSLGGGIYNTGILAISDSTVSGNSADQGAGIYSGEYLSSTSALIIDEGTNISDNGMCVRQDGTRGWATVGAGLYLYFCDATIADSTIAGIWAKGAGFTGYFGAGGGGIFASNSLLTIADSIIERTYVASGCGGGICSEYGDLTVTGSLLENNYVLDGNGGGIWHNGSGVVIDGSEFSYNHAHNGGGLFCHTSGLVTNSFFFGNKAAYGMGGGIYDNGAGATWISHCTVAGNVAFQGAGGPMRAPAPW